MKTATLLFTLLCSADAVAAACGPVPASMQAAVAPRAGGPETLVVESRPVPKVGPRDVLVRVHYASVNPVDWKLQQAGRLPYPAVPGGDFSGTIVAVGADVSDWKCGDAVAGIVDQAARSGSYAEYVAAPQDAIVAKPRRYSFAEAAAYPTVSVAAWRFLVASGKATADDRILVHGGAGGVGSMVVQLADALGATVYATASTRNQDYLKTLGADRPIDYTTERFEDVARDATLVVDTVGGDTLVRSTALPNARIVTMAGRIDASFCEQNPARCPAGAGWDVARGLGHVAPLIEAGKLRVNLDRTFSLAQAAEAQRYNQQGHTRGKVVIKMPAAEDEAGVRVALQAYLDGHASGSEAAFRRAFAPDAVLFGFKGGQYAKRSVDEYLAGAAGGKPAADEAQRRRFIRSVTVTGDVATAVVELQYPAMHALDHMSLLRFDDGWRIVAKTYIATTPANGRVD